ncbi:MAG: phosphoglucosamine mutase, partial [Prolixibacteraceae bacterium]|nr:phosphoglucosamine mutase [Prolixibacteraceae bacterium]MBN2774527.1 phosphoglucosamine mutase [Prolixibacteraceae bacterium]
MTLIKSISGIRGTIGGKPGEGLSPVDVVKYSAAYAEWCKKTCAKQNPTVVVGRDARISGEMISNLVISTLNGMGCNVVNIGLATTPTTEIAVPEEKADGGIILTASHNPKQWNALKLLNSGGEFLNADEGAEILKIAEKEDFNFAEVDSLGKTIEKDYTKIHIQKVLDLKLVDATAIKSAGFKVAVDAVNSVGSIVLPPLLKELGVAEIVKINCEATGHFAHTPEPIPENLVETAKIIHDKKVDVGFVVDPDV